MRKFRFSLQRLLDYRQKTEEKLLSELATLQAELEQAEARLRTVVAQKDAFAKRFEEILSDADADTARIAASYLSGLREQVDIQKAAVRQTKNRVLDKTEQVVEAAKERKALEKLRERRFLEHSRELDRQHQLFLDDLATLSHARASAEPDSSSEVLR